MAKLFYILYIYSHFLFFLQKCNSKSLFQNLVFCQTNTLLLRIEWKKCKTALRSFSYVSISTSHPCTVLLPFKMIAHCLCTDRPVAGRQKSHKECLCSDWGFFFLFSLKSVKVFSWDCSCSVFFLFGNWSSKKTCAYWQ